jgi:hypothetical protein
MTTNVRGRILRLLSGVVCVVLALFSVESLGVRVSAQTNGPLLLTQANSTRAIALESVTLKRQPFSVRPESLLYGSDPRTRITLFAMNLTLQPGEEPSAVTVDAEDESHRHYVFNVEYVGKVSGEESLSQVVVRLSNDITDDVGDILVRLSYRGVVSNSVRVGIGRVGNGPFSALEFDGSPQTVDYGTFWETGVDLGKFFWEFWAMPGPNAGATYMLSDGYGGAHALLFGFAEFDPVRYSLFGDIFDGEQLTFFASDDGPTPGEWGHYAVGWDGHYIVTYYNGVPVGKAAFAGPRRTPGIGGGGGRLLIGGSDHNNLIGRIAQVRGYEGVDHLQELYGNSGTTSAFAPEPLFGVRNASGGPASSFLTSFLRLAYAKTSWTRGLGVRISGNSLTKTSSTGWNAGASSTEAIRSGDGYAEFTATETFTDRMFGLSNVTHHAFGEIDYAINLKAGGGVAAYQSGAGAVVETYTTGDKFRISLNGGVVQFLKNGRVFYTSLVPPRYPLWVDTSLYNPGATIANAVIVGALEPVAEVPDLAGGRAGLVRGVGFGILDPRLSFPLPQFVLDQNFSLILADYGENVLATQIDTGRPVPAGARVFDSFSRKSSTLAFNGPGGLDLTEGGSDGPQPWIMSGPTEAVDGPTTFGILNGRAVILSRGPGVAWVPTDSVTGNLETSVDRRPGLWGSGFDTGVAFRVLDGRNFFFAFTSGGEDSLASERSLTVGYRLNGIETLLASDRPMPSAWTTLRVTTSGALVDVYADSTLVYRALSVNMTNGKGSGLYNHRAGMGLTNRWDNVTVREASP